GPTLAVPCCVRHCPKPTGWRGSAVSRLLRGPAQRSILLALRSDPSLDLLRVQLGDRFVRLRVRCAAADLARATAAADLGLQPRDLWDVALAETGAGLSHEILVGASRRTERRITGEAELHP